MWVSRGTVAAAGPLPRTGGSEGAGVTEEGRRVAFRGAGIGVARDGSYAERIAVPASALADVPDGVTDAQAAGVGVAGVTALDIVELGGVEAGTVVLVLGAAGGVAPHGAAGPRAGRGVIAQTPPRRTSPACSSWPTTSLRRGRRPRERGAGRAPDDVDVVFDGLSGPFTGPAVRLLERARTPRPSAPAPARVHDLVRRVYRKMASILGYCGPRRRPAEVAVRMEHLMAESPPADWSRSSPASCRSRR